MVCISACTKYLHREVENLENKDLFKEFIVLENKIDEALKSENEHKKIDKKNTEIYCCIISKTIEELYENHNTYNQIFQKMRISDDIVNSSYDKSKKNNWRNF